MCIGQFANSSPSSEWSKLEIKFIQIAPKEKVSESRRTDFFHFLGHEYCQHKNNTFLSVQKSIDNFLMITCKRSKAICNGSENYNINS